MPSSSSTTRSAISKIRSSSGWRPQRADYGLDHHVEIIRMSEFGFLDGKILPRKAGHHPRRRPQERASDRLDVEVGAVPPRPHRGGCRSTPSARWTGTTCSAAARLGLCELQRRELQPSYVPWQDDHAQDKGYRSPRQPTRSTLHVRTATFVFLGSHDARPTSLPRTRLRPRSPPGVRRCASPTAPARPSWVMRDTSLAAFAYQRRRVDSSTQRLGLRQLAGSLHRVRGGWRRWFRRRRGRIRLQFADVPGRERREIRRPSACPPAAAAAGGSSAEQGVAPP